MRGPILCAAFLALVSCMGEDSEPGRAWSVPSKDVVDTGLDSVVVGRLWVTPNPIRIRPEWGGTWIGDAEWIPVSVENIGTETVMIEHARIEGTSDVILTDGVYRDTHFPVRLFGRDCGGNQGWHFALQYIPIGSGLDDAQLVIETNDPTTPTLRVPIELDESGSLTPVRTQGYWPADYEAHIWVKPNPIRLDLLPLGTSTEIELCIKQMGDREAIITDTWVHGSTFEYTPGPWGDGYDTAQFTYTSVGDWDLDGALVVEFTDSWGDELTLVVPVIVR